MKKILSVVFVVAFAMSAQVQASGPSAYETLEKFFNEASQPASYSDIDVAGAASNQVCVVAGFDTYRPFSLPMYHYQNVELPGVPSGGPLFPGVLGSVKPDCLILDSAATSVSGLCSKQESLSGPNELRITYISVSDTSFSLVLRKSGEFVAFRIDGPGMDPNGNVSPIPFYYGYCFRE